ncbi:MAG: PQQ-binding-like beta-propeller repeat protein, partial [Planctomycetota bacterium]|nr:PQQ-binding-like beta-propeller repeat protein [Planctomycetota bacterium]
MKDPGTDNRSHSANPGGRGSPEANSTLAIDFPGAVSSNVSKSEKPVLTRFNPGKLRKPIMLKSLTCLSLTLTLATWTLAAEPVPERHWPNWRGPNHGGTVAQGNFLKSWNEKEGILWKVALPGPGCSTPIVWDNQIILTCEAADQDTVMALDWSGNKLWQTAVGKQRGGKHRNGSGSNPSGITDGNYVFGYFKSGHLAGLTIKGKLLWKTNLQQRYGKDTLY